MRWLLPYISSSIGKKQLLALTGIFMNLFLFVHILGNALLFVGEKPFNIYAHQLTSTKLIYFAEFLLASIFILHILNGIRIYIENVQARPVRYYIRAKTGKGADLASSTMIYTGIIILAFMIFHILHFKYGIKYEVEYDGLTVRNLYKLVVESYANSSFMSLYVASLFFMWPHLLHGIRSILDTFGINHPKYSEMVGFLAKFYATLISILFIAIPLFFYFRSYKAI